MGSSGSYFLGFALAALGIIGGARVATVLLVLGLPIAGVAWLIWRCWRRGISPGQGGRDHLHFRRQIHMALPRTEIDGILTRRSLHQDDRSSSLHTGTGCR